MSFGLDQLDNHPVTAVGLVVAVFGALAFLVKFLNDVFGFVKNVREIGGKKGSADAGPRQRRRKGFVLRQKPDLAKTILTGTAAGGIGLGIGSVIARGQPQPLGEAHQDSLHHHPGDHLGDGVGAHGGDLGPAADVHDPLSAVADHDHGFWHFIAHIFDSFTNQ